MNPADGPSRVRFGPFEVDLRTGELWRDGIRIVLQEQPFRVLGLLLERPAELVTREEIRRRLWSESVFTNFEHGLNKAVNKPPPYGTTASRQPVNAGPSPSQRTP